ncbi:Hypp2216 [Branchiostoma lanceolatum]|uniref:Hypp2216 protein n=1 Tax=Branchiostoma lanceolatum TaxID=7740 RepID=A0A8J9ZPF5_BRALA|nr:Hypp2216 [Branchiostoma lanceolatum]
MPFLQSGNPSATGPGLGDTSPASSSERTVFGQDLDVAMTDFVDTSPERVPPPELPDIISSLSTLLGNRRDTREPPRTSSSEDVLGIPDLKREPTMTFSTGKLKVSEVLRIFHEEGHAETKAKLQRLLQKLESSLQAKPSCSSLRIMTNGQLRDTLHSLQQPTNGSRKELIQKVYQASKRM